MGQSRGRLKMKKDIYIIKNSVNNKVYIGQAKNAAERWLSHIYNAVYENKKSIDKQVIHRAMALYGYDKFHYEILESQIENYDKREQYWIKKYNSLVPNGYNVSVGGNGVGYGINAVCSIIKDENTLMNIITEISSSKKTFSNIAKKYCVGEEVISAINNGHRYKIDGFIYPLRNTRYSLDLLKQIRYSLRYETDISLKEIAKKYNIDCSQVSAINQGKIYYVKNEDYPIRKKRRQDLDDDIVNKIIDDIISSELSLSEIAIKYKVSKVRISGINNGRFYIRNNLKYPLRKQNDERNGRRKFIDREIVLEIHKMLRSGTSVSEISKKYNISKTTINNINSGKEKRYYIEGIKYPIKNKKHYKNKN